MMFKAITKGFFTALGVSFGLTAATLSAVITTGAILTVDKCIKYAEKQSEDSKEESTEEGP